ncbi:hypothetical protein [Streptomyces sp. NPDC020298]|uniref:hypothetical protein n=1 Tax=unclassified Streptomyces TaxID=2593676 RepID=UPI0033C257EB
MTQPPGWPPPQQQQPPQQPYPGPYSPQPPAQAPGQVPNPYATQPAYGGPYGAGQYGGPGQYGAYPPPPPPPPGGGGREKKKLALIVSGAAAAVLLIAGGVYFATNGDDKPNKPLAQVSESAEATPTPSASETPPETDAPSDPSDEDTATAPATGFQGQWQDDANKTLTIGDKYNSGTYKGKYALSYIDPGGKGILTGLGMDRSDGTFRMVLKPMSTQSTKGDDYLAATLTRSGDSVNIKWDDGGSDTLAYVGD